MIVVGLTGSIGMGKSATAEMFAKEGVLVYDADQTVHDLYAGRAAQMVEAEFPGTVYEGVVDRDKLGDRVIGNVEALKKLEAIIHPLVREEEIKFLDTAQKNKEPIVLLDIPLLFETGGEKRVDVIVVVSAGNDIQRERVLAREGMTEDRFKAIKKKQLPDEHKRARADYIVDTSISLEDAQRQVKAILLRLKRT